MLENGFYRDQQDDVIRAYQYPHGGSMSYVCDLGYANATDSTITCDMGLWRPAEPKCIRGSVMMVKRLDCLLCIIYKRR